MVSNISAITSGFCRRAVVYQWNISGIPVEYTSDKFGGITTVVQRHNNGNHCYYHCFTTDIHCFTSGKLPPNFTTDFQWYTL